MVLHKWIAYHAIGNMVYLLIINVMNVVVIVETVIMMVA